MMVLHIGDKQYDHWAIGTGIATVLGTAYFLKFLNNCIQKYKLKKVREQKREECKKSKKTLEEQIEQLGLSKTTVDNITSLPLSELQQKIRSDELDILDVLHAYQAKAIACDHKTNCIIEPFTEAEEWAKAVKAEGNKDLPLYGVPVTLKDNYGVKGYDSCYGMSVRINKPSADDAVIVKILKQQGAIPFVKTNVPQTMIAWDCSNPIFGATKNPHDVTRTPGGSSGGEAAMLAENASILGFGSDIGGSIRIPSNMCGTYGLKCTVGRISPNGTHGCTKGQAIVKAAYGPMSRDVDTLVVTMKALLVPAMFTMDPTTNPLPFRNELYETDRKLRIGWYDDDGYFTPPPALQRGVAVAKEALEKAGHTLVPWRPPSADYGTTLYVKAMFSDKCKTINNMLQHDKVDQCFAIQKFAAALPWVVRWFALLICNVIMPNFARGLKAIAGCDSGFDYWNLQQEVDEYRDLVIKDWKKHNLDAAVCPGFGTVAIPIGTPALATNAVSYTALYNVLNFPAGSVPVTNVTADDVAKVDQYKAPEPSNWTVKKGMKGSEGLPVNVQCITLPWQEELCLRVMSNLEQALKQSS